MDDRAGDVLDDAGAKATRGLEMDLLQKMGVYERATSEEAARSGRGKVIKGQVD